MNARPLSSKERALLASAIEGCGRSLELLAAKLSSGELLTAKEAEMLRNAVGDELARTGVDAELGAINDRGRRLDELIDRIGELSTLYERE